MHHRSTASPVRDNADPLANGKIFHVKDLTAMTSPRPNHILKAAMLQRANKETLANPFLAASKNPASASSLISRMLSTEQPSARPTIASMPSANILHKGCTDNFDPVKAAQANAPNVNNNLSENTTDTPLMGGRADKPLPVGFSPNSRSLDPISRPVAKIDSNTGKVRNNDRGSRNALGNDVEKSHIDTRIENIVEKTNKENSLSNVIETGISAPDSNSADVTLIEWRLQRVPNDQQVCVGPVLPPLDHQTFCD